MEKNYLICIKLSSRFFYVAYYESELKIEKFKIADPICQTKIKKRFLKEFLNVKFRFVISFRKPPSTEFYNNTMRQAVIVQFNFIFMNRQCTT